MTAPIKPQRTYRIVGIRKRDNRRVILFPGPLTHREACTCKSKLTPYPWRLDLLEEISTENTPSK